MPDVRAESDLNPLAHVIEWGLGSSIEKENEKGACGINLRGQMSIQISGDDRKEL